MRIRSRSCAGWPALYPDAVIAGILNRQGRTTAYGHRFEAKLGDGLMALFGYPKAQESDAERAVRAALAIRLTAKEGRDARGVTRKRRYFFTSGQVESASFPNASAPLIVFRSL